MLLADVLRCHGLAARLASGYLWEDGSQSGLEHAENAFHAWVEAFLPGAGWIGLDPTNGIFCDHHFLATILGRYYGEKAIASTLQTGLTIVKS